MALLLILFTAGCADEDVPARREPGRLEAPTETVTTAAPAHPWAVSALGAGPARIGMTLGELLPLLDEPVDTAEVGADCTYVAIEGAPSGLLFMVENRRLARIDVVGGEIRTIDGAGIGDEEATVASIYPGVRVMPHKYTSGHYLVAFPGLPADSLHRIVFETDGTRVTEYRAGVYPPVEYVERCG